MLLQQGPQSYFESVCVCVGGGGGWGLTSDSNLGGTESIFLNSNSIIFKKVGGGEG